MAWHVRSGPFPVLYRKSMPAGKKYTSGAGGAVDKLQLCHSPSSTVSDTFTLNPWRKIRAK